MEYLSAVADSGCESDFEEVDRIKNKLLASNPILEGLKKHIKNVEDAL